MLMCGDACAGWSAHLLGSGDGTAGGYDGVGDAVPGKSVCLIDGV